VCAQQRVDHRLSRVCSPLRRVLLHHRGIRRRRSVVVVVRLGRRCRRSEPRSQVVCASHAAARQALRKALSQRSRQRSAPRGGVSVFDVAFRAPQLRAELRSE
jgi:hypothetical protein